MQALSDNLDLASSALWQGATRFFPTGHAMIEMDKLSDLAQPAWVFRARQLIRQIGGRPYGVSELAVAELHERLLAGRNSTLGGCQFVKSLRRGEPASFCVVRELGRAREAVDVGANDDVIFAGCWRMRTKQAGKLVHAGALATSDDCEASTKWPSDITNLPFIVRRAIPVIITLDGAVLYPQIIKGDPVVTSTDTAFSAQFLGR
jgi:hypothetical protein